MICLANAAATQQPQSTLHYPIQYSTIGRKRNLENCATAAASIDTRLSLSLSLSLHLSRTAFTLLQFRAVPRFAFKDSNPWASPPCTAFQILYLFIYVAKGDGRGGGGRNSFHLLRQLRLSSLVHSLLSNVRCICNVHLRHSRHITWGGSSSFQFLGRSFFIIMLSFNCNFDSKNKQRGKRFVPPNLGRPPHLRRGCQPSSRNHPANVPLVSAPDHF